MVTNRKKLKNRKKTLKIVLLSTFFVLTISAVLGYFLWTAFISKTHYISPLSTVLSSDSSLKSEKDVAKLEALLREKKIEFVSINPTETTYLIRLKNDAEITLSAQKNISEQISSLQFILSRLTMEGRRFSRLDLTFDKPIIVFE
jgi:cell division septal protein FtsQ